MAREFVETLFIEPADISFSGTAVEVPLFTRLIPGGTLGTRHRLRFTTQGKFSVVNDATTLTLRLRYGVSTVAVTVKAIGAPFTDKGIVVKGYLSGDESIAIQAATVVVMTGLSRLQQDGIPTTTLLISENSNGDLNSQITAQFDVSSGSNSFTHYNTTIEKISFIEDPPLPDPDMPGTKIVIVSKLNNLPVDMLRAHTFYMPLTHDLIHSGIGDAIFIRNYATTAVWRDGNAHAITANQPRFSYSGANPRGILFGTSAAESLQLNTANALHDSDPICWIENGVFKYTPSSVNIFNSDGKLNLIGPVYIRDILKLKLGRNLTSTEVTILSSTLT